VGVSVGPDCYCDRQPGDQAGAAGENKGADLQEIRLKSEIIRIKAAAGIKDKIP
jgi:hypothetical protein